MREKLLKILSETDTGILGQVLKARRNKEVYDWILENSEGVTGTMKEKIYYVLNQPEIYCPEGNRRKFVSFTDGYRFCGNLGVCKCFND